MADGTIAATRRGHKNARNDLTAEYVRSILAYDPETGIFRWRHRSDATKSWNTQNAGNVTGHVRRDGNAVIVVNYKIYLAHRLAWLLLTGHWPAYEIDHINGKRSDNRHANLREATSQENLRNQTKKPSNTSGYKGVSLFRRDGTWKAQIRANGTNRHIGYYKTKEEAYRAYCEEATRLHGKFARV